MSTVSLTDARWRKSTRSTGNGNDGNCVEVAMAGPGAAVRDSKNIGGPILTFSDRAWRGLLTAIG